MRISPVLPIGTLLAGELAPRDTAVPFGVLITQCTVPGVVALTFDDGPYYHTPHVLDLLDQYGAKGTFFVNGHNFVDDIDDESTPWPEILRRMDGSGHQVASHTWSHVEMSAADAGTREEQVQKLEAALTKILGKVPTYFRPPYATCDANCLAFMGKKGYHVVNFNLDTKDYENNTPETIVNSKNTFAAAVDAGGAADSFLVLEHDVWEQTAISLLPFMLDKIHEKGYRAVTVGECLSDPAVNWYRSA